MIIYSFYRTASTSSPSKLPREKGCYMGVLERLAKAVSKCTQRSSSPPIVPRVFSVPHKLAGRGRDGGITRRDGGITRREVTNIPVYGLPSIPRGIIMWYMLGVLPQALHAAQARSMAGLSINQLIKGIYTAFLCKVTEIDKFFCTSLHRVIKFNS